jgi:hypothetical protein
MRNYISVIYRENTEATHSGTDENQDKVFPYHYAHNGCVIYFFDVSVKRAI